MLPRFDVVAAERISTLDNSNTHELSLSRGVAIDGPTAQRLLRGSYCSTELSGVPLFEPPMT